MKKITVNLIDYNRDWERQFTYEKNRIIGALGDRIRSIEHIGSTSIIGLKAKPIIDILVGIQDLDDVSLSINSLNEIDYEYIPKPELKDRRFFRKGLWGQGTCHLHICEYNSTEWKEMVWFRDYLRLYPKVAKQYATLKVELATTYKFDRQTYTKKKEPFIRMIIEKAMKELGNK